MPAFFAIALPASVAVRRARLPELGLAVLAAAWALVSILWFRPPLPPPGYVVAPISDWRVVSGARIYPADTAFGLNGNQAADLYARGVRGYFRAAKTRGATGERPERVRLHARLDRRSGVRRGPPDLGDRHRRSRGAARCPHSPIADRPAGHRKQVDEAWYVARFTPPGPGEDPKVTAARHALTCGQLKELMDDVDGQQLVAGCCCCLAGAVTYCSAALQNPTQRVEIGAVPRVDRKRSADQFERLIQPLAAVGEAVAEIVQRFGGRRSSLMASRSSTSASSNRPVRSSIAPNAESVGVVRRRTDPDPQLFFGLGVAAVPPQDGRDVARAAAPPLAIAASNRASARLSRPSDRSASPSISAPSTGAAADSNSPAAWLPWGSLIERGAPAHAERLGRVRALEPGSIA